MATPAWNKVFREHAPQQGDYVPRVVVSFLPDDYGKNDQTYEVSVGDIDAIVVTQTCDLVNEKSGGFIAVCAVYDLEQFLLDTKRDKSWVKQLHQSQISGFHLLMPHGDHDGHLIVDFHKLHTSPSGLIEARLRGLKYHWRLASPCLEDMTHRFGDCYSRVAVDRPALTDLPLCRPLSTA